jgi:hypothetical protein
MTLVTAWMLWRRNVDLLVSAGTSTRLDWIQCGFNRAIPDMRPYASQLWTSTYHTSVCVHQATRYFRSWNHKIHSNPTNDLLLLCSSKICWWWATSIFGGQVKFEILVAQGQPHHFWISETLVVLKLISFCRLCSSRTIDLNMNFLLFLCICRLGKLTHGIATQLQLDERFGHTIAGFVSHTTS